MKNAQPKTIFYAMLYAATLSLSSTAYGDVKDSAKEAYHESKKEIREAADDSHATYKDVKEKAKDKTQHAWDKTKDTSEKAWKSTKEAFNEGVLAGKLETAIVLNKHLNPLEIDIDVDGDTARLSGSVESEVEKDLAQAIAEGVDGIDRVQNDLTVDQNIQRQTTNKNDNKKRREFSQYIDDVSTTAAIKTELLANDNIQGMNINVDTFNNEVTLTGTVKRKSQKSLAENIVKKRDSVVRIVNNLRISS